MGCSTYSDRYRIAHSQRHVFHIDCCHTLRAHYDHDLSIAHMWRMGSALNPLALPQPRKEQLHRERLHGEALLKLNTDHFSDDLGPLFRLPVEIQCQIARLAAPCLLSSLAVVLTTMVPLLKRSGLCLSRPAGPYIFPVTPESEQGLISLAGAIYIKASLSDRVPSLSTRRRGAQKIRVRVGYHGICKLDRHWGELDDRPSPW